MKKVLVVCLLVFGWFAGLYADSAADTQFQQYVKMTREHKNNPPGMTVCADPVYRIIYAAMPIAINKADLTPEIRAKMKKSMLETFRTPDMKADCKIIRDLKISIVYTLITTDRKIVTVSFSYHDL